MRVEVTYREGIPDGRATRLASRLRAHASKFVASVRFVDIYLIEIADDDREREAAAYGSRAAVRETLVDPVSQEIHFHPASAAAAQKWDFAVEVRYRAGVTDPVGATASEALASMNAKPNPGAPRPTVRSAVQYLFQAPGIDRGDIKRVVASLHNPLVQQATVVTRTEWNNGTRFPAAYDGHVAESPDTVERFEIARMSDVELEELSRSRLLALSAAELSAVRRCFSDAGFLATRRTNGLDPQITDVEIEMIAQTWSEHCKHKIFNADIEMADETGVVRTIRSLFQTYIRSTTDEVAPTRPFLKSVFHDNSGIIQFDDEHLVCFKVETHNSPSALDPYGGAITGIVGVNRDILGTGKGARPIFNTNVLCFGPSDLPEDALPNGLLHPRVVLDGVHAGIVDGGNQSGIPVVAGAFLFDESYAGKPLVYCGTGGILPARINGEASEIKHVEAGDFAVMLGGRIGKDGIHGATFSSLALDESSPVSAVQIGDPITQRKLTDFLLAARDAGLYKGITDNGAGGLSSSLGEMAELSGGVRIELDACPLKYPGLAAWEILVSESQERMSLSVAAETLEEFLALAARRDVEATVVGQFTDDGFVRANYRGRCVCLLPLEFLHEGLPKMTLRAVPEPQPRLPPGEKRTISDVTSLRDTVLRMLRDPNIGSKEDFVRQYDHEVKGQSIVKPFCGPAADGPTDGAVVKPLFNSFRGLSVTHGICPSYGDVDARSMAMCAVDEAYRSHIILSGDPDAAAALDNFCWPDPVQSATNPAGAQKLAQLVRACEGLHDACVAYGLPLISGKDSMKNDAVVNGKRLSVRPTLLVSLMGIVPDIRNALTADFKEPGDLVYLLGVTRAELGGSAFHRIALPGPRGAVLDPVTWPDRRDRYPAPCPRPEEAVPLYRALSKAISAGFITSGHDLSDGGLAIALCESALAGRLGAWVDLSTVSITSDESTPAADRDTVALFSESASRFIVTVGKEHRSRLEETFTDLPCVQIGQVTESESVELAREGMGVARLELEEIVAAWQAPVLARGEG